MIAYRAHFSGSIAYVSTNIPCFKCGYGTVCEVGSSQKVYGEEGRKNLKITNELFKIWEYSPETVRLAKDIAKKLQDL